MGCCFNSFLFWAQCRLLYLDLECFVLHVAFYKLKSNSLKYSDFILLLIPCVWSHVILLILIVKSNHAIKMNVKNSFQMKIIITFNNRKLSVRYHHTMHKCVFAICFLSNEKKCYVFMTLILSKAIYRVVMLFRFKTSFSNLVLINKCQFISQNFKWHYLKSLYLDIFKCYILQVLRKQDRFYG